MKLLVLDLELNKTTDEDQGGVITDIIQIGACVMDTKTGEVLDTFSQLCKLRTPMENGELRLSKFIEKLTNIKQYQIDASGIDLDEAYEKLIEFKTKHGASTLAAQWGGGDFEELRYQVEFKVDYTKSITKEIPEYDPEKYNLHVGAGKYILAKKVPTWVFGRSAIDVKKLFQVYQLANNISYRGGLAKSMTKLGLTFNGTKHDAKDDAVNTARILWALMQKMKSEVVLDK